MKNALWRIAVMAAAACASACSNAAYTRVSPPLTAQAASDPVQSHAPSGFGSWLYTCSAASGDCKLYTVSGTKLTYSQIVTPPGRPLSGFATAAGKWYEALISTSDVVTYTSTGKGPTGPTSTLQDTGALPIDVVANTAHKLVAVSNEFGANNGPPNVEVYLNGATSPTRSVTYTPKGGKGAGFGVATDSHGNCFWMVDDLNNFNADVVEFTGCAGSAKLVVATPRNGAAGGLAVDGSDNLYYVDQSNGVYKCAGTTNCKKLAGGFQDPTDIRFDAGWKHLWLTDTGSAKIIAIDPATGKVLSRTTEVAGPAPGLALAPGPAY